MAKGYSAIPQKSRLTVRREFESIVNTFKKRRVELKITQEGMAEETGVSVETIRHIEQGRRIPSLPMFLHLARYLRLRISVSLDR